MVVEPVEWTEDSAAVVPTSNAIGLHCDRLVLHLALYPRSLAPSQGEYLVLSLAIYLGGRLTPVALVHWAFLVTNTFQERMAYEAIEWVGPLSRMALLPRIACAAFRSERPIALAMFGIVCSSRLGLGGIYGFRDTAAVAWFRRYHLLLERSSRNRGIPLQLVGGSRIQVPRIGYRRYGVATRWCSMARWSIYLARIHLGRFLVSVRRARKMGDLGAVSNAITNYVSYAR